MAPKSSVPSLAVFALLVALATKAFGQPTTLNLVGKLRDFREVVNTTDRTNPLTHPDFNDRNCGLYRGAVAQTISTAGAVGDSAVFAMDNREPLLVSGFGPTGTRCYESQAHFTDWFNDKSMNRPFLTDLVFTRQSNGTYVFEDDSYFPLDSKTPAEYRNLPGRNDVPFGHLNSCCNHNFGFTLEFHATFTYVAGSNQDFHFRGDDDVWVFVNGRLAIDLGGVHSAENASFNLDAIAASHGLVNGQNYILDFYFAERHVTQSNLMITTTILLDRPAKVATPVATPGTSSFTSQVNVTLSTPTPGATIYYTTNGSVPDSNSTRYVPGTPVNIIGTTTLRAIAYRDGWTKSDVMQAVYTKNVTASVLEILDASGNPLTGGYLSEKNTAYMVRITTAQAGVSTLNPVATTQTLRDTATLALSNPAAVSERFIFSGTVPFAIAAARVANGSTEAATYDSLTVRWVNPRDPADVAVRTVAVRPAPKQATAYFSTKRDGSDNTTQYVGTEDTLYVIVVDQVLPAGAAPRVILVTDPAVAASPEDRDTLGLTAVPGKPGTYVAIVPVDRAGATVPGNERLRLANADQITATYQDPVDTEGPAVANAGYGAPAVIAGSLQFTDASGNVLPADVHWSPAEGKLHLQLVDDWLGGTRPTKTATLAIQNNEGRAPADSETVALALVPDKVVGTRAIWEGSIDLKDLLAIVKGNGTAETYILGLVTATVTSHNPDGAAGDVVSDQLKVAYKDEVSKITLVDGTDSTAPIGRVTGSLVIRLNDQSLSSGIDTLTVSLRCNSSTDLVLVKVIEVSPGVYVSKPVTKNEVPGAPANDTVLTCREVDNIRATVVDPVYGTTGEITVPINNPVAPRLYYTKVGGTEPISSVLEESDPKFVAVLEAFGKSVKEVDRYTITFETAQGELETFELVETGAHTQKFTAEIPIAFVAAAIAKGNKTLEGMITAAQLDNRVVSNGSVQIDVNTKAEAAITLVAAFVPVTKAYIKDIDNDGRGDRVYVVFQRKLSTLPGTLQAQWNTGSSPMVPVSGPKISFHNGDSTVVVADYSDNEFGADLTSIPDGAEKPKVKLPENGLFVGQTADLVDSIGPLILRAVKHPADAGKTDRSTPGFNHDTLYITLTEPITSNSPTGLTDMLRRSVECGNYGTSTPIVAYGTPRVDSSAGADPNTYIVIVESLGPNGILKGQCVYLNAEPNKVIDLVGNVPPKLGVEMGGTDRKQIIQLFRGFPPVAGLDPGRVPGHYQVATQDSRNPEKGGYQDNDGVIRWIPPVGWSDANPDYKSYVPSNVREPLSGVKEATDLARFPEGLSAIQVVSTERYVAKVTIYDNHGRYVRSFDYSFGYRGEMLNDLRMVRATKGGYVSWIPWNQKTDEGDFAGQGVYVWKVVFTFASGKQEIQYTRTGVVRPKNWHLPLDRR